MSSDPVIRAEGLGKAYRLHRSGLSLARSMRAAGRAAGGAQDQDLWVLRDVTLTVGRGEAVGIVGRNGAGKSTLLKIVSGTLTPSTGHAQVQGRVGTMLELGAGFHGDFTGRENARFAAAILGLDATAFAAISDRIQAFADIGDFYDRRVSEYSSGMFARLAFAVNIHCDPDILIVDEILSVGDIAFQHKCIHFLRDFRSQGGTLLFVSHDDAAVRSLCDRVLWLDGGRLMDEGPADRVLRRYHTSLWQHQSRSDSFTAQEDAPSDSPDPAPPQRHGLDPEHLPAARQAAGRITALDSVLPDGRPNPVLRGGEMLRLTAAIHAETALEQVRVACLFRNRLAQVVFGGVSPTLPALAAGAGATARMAFRLPYVPTGEYTVEAVLIATEDGQDRRIAQRGPMLLPVQTQHISPGLANLKMRDVRVEVST